MPPRIPRAPVHPGPTPSICREFGRLCRLRPSAPASEGRHCDAPACRAAGSPAQHPSCLVPAGPPSCPGPSAPPSSNPWPSPHWWWCVQMGGGGASSRPARCASLRCGGWPGPRPARDPFRQSRRAGFGWTCKAVQYRCLGSPAHATRATGACLRHRNSSPTCRRPCRRPPSGSRSPAAARSCTDERGSST